MISLNSSIIDKKEIKNYEFREIIYDFVKNLTNNSKDKALLDQQVVDQIIDMTYKYNSSLNATFFSSNLMPKDLYDKLKFTPWRLHSFEKASFLIELPKNENSIHLQIIFKLFLPQLFELRKKIIKKKEKKKQGEIEEEEIEEESFEPDDTGDIDEPEEIDDFSSLEDSEESNEKYEYSNSSKEVNENIKNKPFEHLDFEYEGENYSIEDPITGPLNYLHLKLDLEISNLLDNQNQTIMKSLDISGNFIDESKLIEETEKSNLKLDSIREDFRIDVEIKSLNILADIDDIFRNRNIYQISISLKNKRMLGGETRKAARKRVFKKSIICPLIDIKIIEGNLIDYVQSLTDLIKIFKKPIEEREDFYKSQKLIHSFSKQVNCILTFKNRNLLYITPFGIFDQLRYKYEELELDANFDEFDNFQNKLINDGVFQEDEINFLSQKNVLFKNFTYIEQVFLIFKAIKEYLRQFTEGAINPKIRLFQWENSIWRIKYLIGKLRFQEKIKNELQKYYGKKIDKDTLKKNIDDITNKNVSVARIIKAPTGSGKTLIFFIDSLLHFYFTKERIAIIFPTRLLNIEMFQNLTSLLYFMNKELIDYDTNTSKITAGLYIGKSQFNLSSFSSSFNNFSLIQKCPECRSNLSFIINQNDVPECQSCHHLLDYIYTPFKDRVNKFIPDILIATPDKIFWDLFIDWRVALRYGNFGTQIIKCPKCGQYTSFLNKDQNQALKEKVPTIKCMEATCNHTFQLDRKKIERKLIGFIILDEIHSVSGLTGIFLSKLLKAIKWAQKKYLGNEKGLSFDIEIETGTATIAEEEDFIRKLVEKKVSVFPSEDDSFIRYFILQEDNVRYRILVLNTVFSALRRVFSYSSLYSYLNYNISRIYDPLISNYDANSLDLCCGYVYRKNDGYTTKQSIYDFGKSLIVNRNALALLNNQNLYFISGNSEQPEIYRFLEAIKNNKVSLFIANQVVSLGLNIKDLNRMILFGTPKSMNEQIQTIGRIGRTKIPGISTILLYPNLPRDEYLYENFHFYFLNCEKLYEPNPIQNFNLYISEVFTPNLFLLYLYTELEKDYHYKMQRDSKDYWSSTSLTNQKLITRFILNILSGTEPEFTENYKKEIFKKIRIALERQEDFIRIAEGNDQINQILDRNNLLVRGLRRDSGQVGIRISELNPHLI